MTRAHRILSSLMFAPVFALACDAGAPAPAPAAAGLDQKAADEKKLAEEKAAAKKVADEKKATELAHPWIYEDVREGLRGGAKVVYAQTGTDGAGKAVEDDWACTIAKSTEAEVGVTCNGVNHPSKDKGAGQVAMTEWNQFSPFFTVSRAEETLVGREEVTVPAGTFKTVKAEVKDFFGAHYTVWMIEDQPGIYAKVHKHANTADESDKTDMVFELKEVSRGG
jgi:hypothetical protein